MRRFAGIAIASTLLSPGTEKSTSPAPQSQGPSATRVAAGERFEFHSDPWINLHHFLYHWSRDERGLGQGRQRVVVPERGTLATLPAAERETWTRAVVFYRDSVAEKSHFDERMLEQKRRLLELRGDSTTTMLPDVIPGIAAQLAQAMPIYRNRWWPQHDQANRAWIASVAPRLRRHESRYVDLTRRIYGAEWPSVPFRVDVSAYANARAGYTAERHIVIYSTDAGNQELHGLETLLHEVQHTREVASTAREALTRTFESARTDEPQNLWHGLIFATAGTFLQLVAEQEGLPAHEPYWIREGFETLRGWSAIVPAVRKHWVPVVQGAARPDDSFAALVRSFQGR